MWNFFATSNEIGRVVKLGFIISSGRYWGKSRLNETVFRFSPCFDFEENHWVELSHLLPRCRGKRSERKHSCEQYSIFFNLAEWFLVELRAAICVSRRSFSATFFWRISFLFWFSDFEQKSCKIFPQVLSAIFSELTSLCPEDQIEKTSVSWKIQTFFNNSGLWAITWYNFWQKLFRQACQKWLLLVQKTFWRKQFFEIFYKMTCFWFWAKNVWQDAQTAFTCPVEHWWKVVLFGENESFFVGSAHYVKHYRNIKQKWQGCQLSFHHLQSNFLRKT